MTIKKSDGFTLVEIVISLTIIGILFAVIGMFAVNVLGQTTVESVRASQLGESQIALDKITNDVRLSAGADINNRWADGNKSGGEFTWASNANTLLLATAVVNNNNDVIFADPAKYISEKNNVIYFVKDRVLYKRILASPVAGNSKKTTCPVATQTCPKDSALLQNVNSFSFRYLNGNEQQVTPSEARAIEITVQTTTERFSQTIKSDYVTRAVFRND